MTALRQKYIRDLAIRGKAERTQHSYTAFVADLARYHHKSPDLLSYDQVADWIFHLIRERKLSSSSVNIAVNAVRFLYQTTEVAEGKRDVGYGRATGTGDRGALRQDSAG
jgi:integrase/recombinase XerD